MVFKIDDAKAAEAFTQLIASGSFTLSGKQIIEAYKSFAWFNKICAMIEEDIKNGEELKSKPDRRARGQRGRPRSGDRKHKSERDKGGSKPLSE